MMDLEQVKRFLPMRTADDANLALVLNHTRKIKQYLNETQEWVLPAITLAVSSENVQFKPQANPGVGTIKVSNEDDNERNLFRIVDGQHRHHTIESLLTEYEEKDTKRWTIMDECGLSVTSPSQSMLKIYHLQHVKLG